MAWKESIYWTLLHLWSSSDENSEKEDLERKKTLKQFPGKIKIEVDFFMQYVHTHSLEITQMLKYGCSTDQQKFTVCKIPKLQINILTKLP